MVQSLPTRSMLAVAAVLMLMPASAQLGADVTVVADDAAIVEAELDPIDVPDVSVDAAVEVHNTTAAAINATADEEGALSGRLQLAGGQAQGRHLALHIGAHGIQDYRAGNDTFFAAIDLGALDAKAAGARLDASFASGRLQATDSASAGLRIDADEATDVSLRLGAAATAVPATDRLVWVEAGARSGALAILGNGSMAVDGSSLAIHLAPGSILRFEAQASDEGSWQAEQRAFASGRLGAELAIGAKGDAALADEYTVRVSNLRAGNGSATFTVDSVAPHARVVSVAIDSGLLSSDAEMRFDGQPAKRAASASEVYAAGNASVAIYSLVEAGGILQAVIHVPGFSAHDIEFGPASGAPSEDAPGLGFIPLGGVVALLALVRRLR